MAVTTSGILRPVKLLPWIGQSLPSKLPTIFPIRMLVILGFATDKRSGLTVIGQRKLEANTTATEGGNLERRQFYNPRSFAIIYEEMGCK